MPNKMLFGPMVCYISLSRTQDGCIFRLITSAHFSSSWLYPLRVNEYVKDNCTVIIAPMKDVILPTPNQIFNNGNWVVTLPINSSLSQDSKDVLYKRKVQLSCDSSSTAPWTGYWVVSIRKDDATKENVRLTSCQYTPVFHLRSVLPNTSIFLIPER